MYYFMRNMILSTIIVISVLVTVTSSYAGKKAPPLWAAVAHNNINAVMSILDAGVHPDSADFLDCSVLELAINNKDTSIVLCLLCAKADPNRFSLQPYGFRPLHNAILHEQPRIVKMLLTVGAETAYCDIMGYSPVVLAADKRHESEAAAQVYALLAQP